MLEQNFDDKEAKKKKFYKSLVFWVLVDYCWYNRQFSQA